MSISLKNIFALVCGGSKGIGFASASKLASMGANVTLLARNEGDLLKAISLLPIVEENQVHSYISVDISNTTDLSTKINEKIFLNKNPYLILVNNTGGPPAGLICNAKNDEFILAFQNHLIANHTISTIVLEGMKLEKFGRIINIISTSVKQPLANLGVSNTIRAAVANWSKTLATEVAPYRITVNNVLPGATGTERLDTIIKNKAIKLNVSEKEAEAEMLQEIPMKRFALPEEIAHAVGFLASKESSYITGINIPVDGGRTGCL